MPMIERDLFSNKCVKYKKKIFVNWTIKRYTFNQLLELFLIKKSYNLNENLKIIKKKLEQKRQFFRLYIGNYIDLYPNLYRNCYRKNDDKH